MFFIFIYYVVGGINYNKKKTDGRLIPAYDLIFKKNIPNLGTFVLIGKNIQNFYINLQAISIDGAQQVSCCYNYTYITFVIMYSIEIYVIIIIRYTVGILYR